MSAIDWVRHKWPLKLKDGKRHVFPTLASMVYLNDGKTTLTDENGNLRADKALDADKLGGKQPSEYLLAKDALQIDDNSPAADKTFSSEKIEEELSELKENKVNQGGWTAGKYLGTDDEGNVVEKEGMAGGLTSDPQEGTEAPEMGSVPINADQLGGKTYQMIVDLIYPIGRTITTLDDADNPNNLYPWQEWKQTAKGRFIIGTGQVEANHDGTSPGNYNMALNTTGGEAAHKLTLEELAYHNHPTLLDLTGNTFTTSESYMGMPSSTTGSAPATGTIIMPGQSAGSDVPHNNMPPYLAANIWKRVS